MSTPQISTYVFTTLAHAVAIFHGLLIVFILTGGVAALIWPPVAWIHSSLAVWSVLISILDKTCPLTPLEKWLRAKGGRLTYEGGYIEHYIVPRVYPSGLTKAIERGTIAFLIVINATTYSILFICY